MDSNTLFLGGSKGVIDNNSLISICRCPRTVLCPPTMVKSELPALRAKPPYICPVLFSVALVDSID